MLWWPSDSIQLVYGIGIGLWMPTACLQFQFVIRSPFAMWLWFVIHTLFLALIHLSHPLTTLTSLHPSKPTMCWRHTHCLKPYQALHLADVKAIALPNFAVLHPIFFDQSVLDCQSCSWLLLLCTHFFPFLSSLGTIRHLLDISSNWLQLAAHPHRLTLWHPLLSIMHGLHHWWQCPSPG